jgi:hypothetical protein
MSLSAIRDIARLVPELAPLCAPALAEGDGAVTDEEFEQLDAELQRLLAGRRKTKRYHAVVAALARCRDRSLGAAAGDARGPGDPRARRAAAKGLPVARRALAELSPLISK